MTSTVSSLTSRRNLIQSATWNFMGIAFPMVIAVACMPLLIQGFGRERFGLLAIIWMGVGYFSLFDLGLGRALTKLVANRIGRSEYEGIDSLIWTAIYLLVFLGFLGAVSLVLLTPTLVVSLLHTPENLRIEANQAFIILATGIPVVILSSAFVGLLEAHHRFKDVAKVRIPLGVLTFGGPLLTLQFSPSIVWATVFLLLGRLIGMCFYFVFATRVRKELVIPVRPNWDLTRPLLTFGGWLTVSNLVGPLMTYLDRFFVGAILGLTAVTFYVTPYELVTRAQLLPQAIMGVLFPAIAAVTSAEDRKLDRLFTGSVKFIFWIMLPVFLGLYLFAPEILQVWLGTEFKANSTPVMYWLVAGCFVNCLALPAFTLLQGVGRPDLVAKTHVVELLPYLALVWVLANAYGIAGVAAAWTIRVVIDTVTLNYLAKRCVPSVSTTTNRLYLLLSGVIIVFALVWQFEGTAFRVYMYLVATVFAIVKLWPLVFRNRQSENSTE